MRELSGTPISFPLSKSARILKSSDFRNVYQNGFRQSGHLFAAFCLAVERLPGQGPRFGFTVPRAFGRAVKRNRARRRIREAMRLRLPEIGSQWDIVINPRRPAVTAPVEALRREVDRLVSRCRP
ncbi:MAG TPA: ribonuclease P protein component [Bryobacteraceae bacterium]|nr:ribonuclease P protein component [Bryobacteraceae bacterium]